MHEAGPLEQNEATRVALLTRPRPNRKGAGPMMRRTGGTRIAPVQPEEGYLKRATPNFA
jgi:hypothetical protein